ACKYADIDPNDPTARDALLIALCDGRFSIRRRGNEQLWTPAMLTSLLRRFLVLLARSGKSHAKVLDEVKKQVAHLREYNTEHLRRMLYHALDNEKNPLLKHLLANRAETGFAFERVSKPRLPV